MAAFEKMKTGKTTTFTAYHWDYKKELGKGLQGDRWLYVTDTPKAWAPLGKKRVQLMKMQVTIRHPLVLLDQKTYFERAGVEWQRKQMREGYDSVVYTERSDPLTRQAVLFYPRKQVRKLWKTT